jgi:hypothetical protein
VRAVVRTDIGYDSNNLFMAAYDWRLSFKGLQQRDQYFTKLKHMVELAYDTNNHRKVVILTHSMGSNVLLYFLNWVQADPATNGGDGGAHSRHLTHARNSFNAPADVVQAASQASGWISTSSRGSTSPAPCWACPRRWLPSPAVRCATPRSSEVIIILILILIIYSFII